MGRGCRSDLAVQDDDSAEPVGIAAHYESDASILQTGESIHRTELRQALPDAKLERWQRATTSIMSTPVASSTGLSSIRRQHVREGVVYWTSWASTLCAKGRSRAVIGILLQGGSQNSEDQMKGPS